MSTPNLLYFDGEKEDHNFAGVVNYNSLNPNQTHAGRLTAKFMGEVLTYCLATKREDFKLDELYAEIINANNELNV